MATYLFLPGQPTRCFGDAEAERLPRADTDPGGFFYDHLRDEAGELRGVRYYPMDGPEPRRHPLFRRFSDDGRFVFSPDGSGIDILFYAADAAALREGRISCDCVQDFSGSWAVRVGDATGLCIVVDDGK